MVLREARDVEIASWHIDVGVTGVTPIAERPALVAAYGALSDHGAGMLVAAAGTTEASPPAGITPPR